MNLDTLVCDLLGGAGGFGLRSPVPDDDPLLSHIRRRLTDANARLGSGWSEDKISSLARGMRNDGSFDLAETLQRAGHEAAARNALLPQREGQPASAVPPPEAQPVPGVVRFADGAQFMTRGLSPFAFVDILERDAQRGRPAIVDDGDPA